MQFDVHGNPVPQARRAYPLEPGAAGAGADPKARADPASRRI